MKPNRLRRWLLIAAALVLVLVFVAAAVALATLRASLADLDGCVRVAGLQAEVMIERDDLGVPTIIAGDRLDMAFGLGFVHAQDRFFQMDLTRRLPAGELAELFGPAALEQDRWQRRRRFRVTARQSIAALPADQRAMVDAYAAGANAGLAALGARPPEYWALGSAPAPWQPEDTVLAVIAMALNLSPSPLERQDTLLRRAIGDAAFDFFYPRGTDWDAALDNSLIPPAPMPGPDVLDFRQGWETGSKPLPPEWRETADAAGAPRRAWLADAGSVGGEGSDFAPGSNGWAVDGTVSATGSAVVASDMHLSYSVPGPVYRVRLRWRERDRDHDVIGLTLAGVPAIVTGSNGHVAWAPTAAELDVTDQLVVEVDPAQPRRYRVPGGWADFETVTERIAVRGGPPAEITTRRTIWGPVIESTPRNPRVAWDGQPLVYRYLFDSPEALNLRFFDLAFATTADEALRIAAESGTPIINLLVGDRAGAVGWTVAGRLPRRTGQAGHRVVSWADGTNGWAGWLAPEEHPRLASPQVARVFSANHRKLGSPAYLALAQPDGHLGARATQIRDALNRLTRATPADMVAIQLDDRARLLDRWRDLLRATLQHPGAAADRTNNLPQVDRLVADWHGRATPDSVAYRILRGFRMATLEYIFEPLTTRAAALSGERFWRFADGAERPVWTLLEARPPHLLNPRFATYDDLLLAAVHATVDQLRAAHGGDLAQATWGRASNHPVQHPVSSAVPRLAGWLDLPLAGCGGGDHMPRVHNRWGGSSERLVVSPGHEAEGLIQMFGGQSGDCLSPFYRAGHDAWVRGEPKPLLPGPARHKLRLVPRGTR